MGGYRRLIGNFSTFAVANLATQLVAFVMIPFYTRSLSPAQFGVVDLVNVALALTIPLATASIADSVFRFQMVPDYRGRGVLLNGGAIAAVGSLVTLLMFLGARLFWPDVPWIAVLVLFAQVAQSLLSQFARATDRVRWFAAGGVIQAGVLALSNLVLMGFLGLAVDGYIISLAAASAFTALVLFMATRAFREISTTRVDRALMSQMLTYSVPLIPNTLLWWIFTSAGRFTLLLFGGTATVGVYAVSMRIPTLLSVVTVVFTQAWQITAVERFDGTRENRLFDRVLAVYQAVLFVMFGLVLIAVRPVVELLAPADYGLAWVPVPFLLLGVVFLGLSSFFGVIYTAAMRTSGAMITSLAGAAACILANLVLVPMFGPVGAGVATLLAYVVLWLFRLFDTRRYLVVNVDLKAFSANVLLASVQIAVFLLVSPESQRIVVLGVLAGCSALLNLRTFRALA